MSDGNKKIVKEVGETFKRIVREADDAARKVGGFDKDLGNKLRKAGEQGKEIVRHIEERTEK